MTQERIYMTMKSKRLMLGTLIFSLCFIAISIDQAQALTSSGGKYEVVVAISPNMANNATLINKI